MRHSSSRARCQAEPTVALAAVLAVVLGLTAYATVLADAVPDVDRDVATPTLVRAHDYVTEGGVAVPSRLDGVRRVGPPGFEVNVSLATDERRWAVGPTPRANADRSSRFVGVRTGPGTVRTARLTVEVWT